MVVLRVVFSAAFTMVALMLFASLLTSNPYMRMSKGLYASHDLIEYDHDYVARQLIDYLNYRHDDLEFGANAEDDSVLMRDIEIRHMVDVRDVYTLLRGIALVSLLFVVSVSIILFKVNKRAFYDTYRNIFWLPLGFLVFVGTWFLIDFGRIFTWFHLLLFDNDDWILRSDDVLIMLLPSNFWMVSGIIILVGTAMMIGLAIVLNEKFMKPQIRKNT